MTATVEDVLEYAPVGTDEALAASCLPLAQALVDQWVGEDAVVPENVLDHAVVVVTAELLNQREAPNGIAQFADAMGNNVGMRVGRDPLRPAYPLLRPFTGGGFA